MRNHCFRQFVLVVVLLSAMVWPAFAVAAARPHPAGAVFSSTDAIVLADGWGIGNFLAGGGRSRVIQISVVTMAIGLFIMMRKFNR